MSKQDIIDLLNIDNIELEKILNSTGPVEGRNLGYNWHYYGEERGKNILARLQYILSEEGQNQRNDPNKPHPIFGIASSLNGVFGATGAILDWIPPPATKDQQKKVTINITNNSDCVFIPLRISTYYSYYAEENFNICPPGEETSIRFSLNVGNSTEYGLVSVLFALTNQEGQTVNFDALFISQIKNKVKKWTLAKVSFSKITSSGASFIGDTYSPNSGDDNELHFVRINNPSEGFSCGLATFTTNVITDNAQVNLIITPWRSDADNIR